ncbi:Transcriptional regulatory protein WalR [bioreactor metagenome]|uniref:Transcriptional regulatory protein WalR n=1 Tax=bioreactor metagenome TaxID=1076179 RepID=A0A644X153_9ZZZZ
MSKILIIEDEHAIADIVDFNLKKEGYETAVAYDGREGLARCLEGDFDLILLDVMLPVMDGWEVLRLLREKKGTPVIMLTAREEELDKVHGLELGADDYITKPFSMNELKARIKANIRRVKEYSRGVEDNPSEDVVKVRSITIDFDRMVVVREGTDVELSGREFTLLTLLCKNRGKVFSREELLEQVWEYEGFLGDLRVVDVMVRRIREKIERDPSDPDIIRTRRGAGYYMEI